MEKFRSEDLPWIEVNQAFKNGINTIVIMVGAIERAKIEYMGDPLSARPLIVEKGTKFVSESGVFGDPTHATQTHGTAYLSSVVNYFVTYIQHGLENSNPWKL